MNNREATLEIRKDLILDWFILPAIYNIYRTTRFD